MKRITLVLITFLLGSLSILSQQKTKIISGQVRDSLGIVLNANIINLKTKQGTFSNDKGNFRIFASVGDTLSISSIQHITKKFLVSDLIFESSSNEFTLKINVEKLDEFQLKRHNLRGSLGIDIKALKTDKIDSITKSNLDFSDIDYKFDDPKIDANDRKKPPIANTMAGAIPMAGSGMSMALPSKRLKQMRALRKELDHRKAFPYKILTQLGEKFFFDELKIPVDKYFHFLEYCNPLGIEKLHKEGKLLEIIKILRTESIGYKKILEKND